MSFEHTTYIGVGTKVGGGMIVGFDLVQGRIARLDALQVQTDFMVLNVGIGLTLGGSASWVLALAFNCPSIWLLNHRDVGKGSWSFDLDIGEKWGDLLKALNDVKYLGFLAKIGQAGLRGLGDPSKVLTARSLASDLASAVGAAQSTKPQFLLIGIPGSGAGLQINASYVLEGRLELGNQYTVDGRGPAPGAGGVSGNYAPGARGHGNS